MTGEAAVGVDDDLTARETAIAHRTADHEPTGRVDVELGLVGDPLLRQDGQDDLVHHGLLQRLQLDLGGVLRGEHHGLDADRLVVLVTERALALRVRAQPRQLAVLAHLRLLLDQTVRVDDRRGHVAVGFLRGVTEHQALVAGTLVLRVLAVDALSDVLRLLADRVQHRAGVAVEALVEHDSAHDLLDLDDGVRGDLAGDDDHAGLRHRLAGHAAVRLLRENRVEDRVRDLIRHFVRVAFRHGLRRKQI